MATLETQPTLALTAVQPTSTQPGGGVLVHLELAWGRLRRAGLRRFRPGYVRRMAAKRQGHCENCPHDIIDPRDLKYYRNVCGYWFRAEDDPFRWRKRIPFAGAGMVELVCCTLLQAAIGALLAWAALQLHWLFWLPFAATILLWAEVVYFFRDPPRAIPTDTRCLLSPADGTVTRMGEVLDSDFPEGRAFRISIFLSIFNVHVNRLPCGGCVAGVRYFPGCFLDARHADCGGRNEQLWLDLEESVTGRRVRVKQIAGALARRIVCWLKPGEQVRAGDRYGMIKFGSRTDVLIPAGESMDLKVKVGDKVKGGSTVLLQFSSQPHLLVTQSAERTALNPG